MDKVKLGAKKRTEMGRKTNQGRKAGQVPAVIYGKGIKSESLWVDALDFSRLVKESGESVIIDLTIDGSDDPLCQSSSEASRNVIVNEVQRDPVKNDYRHIDFYQVNMKEKIETEVELIFIGESEAVKAMGGVLVKSIDHIKIKCLPTDLPSHIDVDISKITNFEEHITIKDLDISDKVEIEGDLETVIALVSPPRSEEDLASLDEKVEGDVTDVEGVEKEGDDTGEEGEEKKEGSAGKPAEEKKDPSKGSGQEKTEDKK